MQDPVRVLATRAATAIPRHVELLNELAVRAGLSASAPRIDMLDLWTDAPPQEQLLVDWTGPSSAFTATGLFTVTQLRYFALPTEEHFLAVPQQTEACARSLINLPLLCGFLMGTPESFRLELNFGLPPVKVVHRGGVEVVVTAAHVSRHGTAEALIADGVPEKRLPMGVRVSRDGGHQRLVGRGDSARFEEYRWWACRRLPDGSFIYREDTEAAFKKRERACAEMNERLFRLKNDGPAATPAPSRPRPHLTLVVDNT